MVGEKKKIGQKRVSKNKFILWTYITWIIMEVIFAQPYHQFQGFSSQFSKFILQLCAKNPTIFTAAEQTCGIIQW